MSAAFRNNAADMKVVLASPGDENLIVPGRALATDDLPSCFGGKFRVSNQKVWRGGNAGDPHKVPYGIEWSILAD